jgi:hypothetical protein
MKNLVFIIIAMMSFMNVSVAQWSEISFSNSIEAVTFSEAEVFVFMEGQYNVMATPLNSVYPWNPNDLPESGLVKAAEFTNNLFVLFKNGNLYEKIDANWQLILENVNGISSANNLLFAWTNLYAFEYDDGLWTYQEHIPGVTYIAGGNTIFVAANQSLYQGPRLDQLTLLKENLNINIIHEINIFNDEYVYTGQAIGGFAAYYKSPVHACFAYENILTVGSLESSCMWNGNILIAGSLGARGVIFDGNDMGRMNFFSQTISSIKNNSHSVVAIAGNKIYYQSNENYSLTKVDEKKEQSLKVAPNPVENKLRLFSEKELEAQVFVLNGQQVAHLFIKEGNNEFQIQGWRPGVYLLRPIKSQEQSIKFVIK